jgi:hypothetical protein
MTVPRSAGLIVCVNVAVAVGDAVTGTDGWLVPVIVKVGLLVTLFVGDCACGVNVKVALDAVD